MSSADDGSPGMVPADALGVFLGAIGLGAIHGIEPGHGWPVAASYALDRSNKWLYGVAASLIIGVGHLVSSVAMVAVFFYAKSYFDLTRANEPISLLGVRIGGPVSIVAGVLLLALGVREYRHGHAHAGEGHAHGPTDTHAPHGAAAQTRDASPHGYERYHDRGDGHHRPHRRADGRHDHGHHSHPDRGAGHHSGHGVHRSDHDGRRRDHRGHHGFDSVEDRGLLGIAWFAFVLGFAHEEEFEIIAMCLGSRYCLELMGVYALTVIAAIVGFTVLLIAGYDRFEARVDTLVPYLPLFSAAVLGAMGLGFILGLF